jgi:hypothetical protein
VSPHLERTGWIIRFLAIVELGAGIVLVVDPALVGTWLLGTPLDATAQAMGRWCGIALLANFDGMVAGAWL